MAFWPDVRALLGDYLLRKPKSGEELQRVTTLRFRQWLAEWDKYTFDPALHRRKPEPYLYLFAMKAAQLRQLCDVYRRKRDGSETEGIQRSRDESRTGRIRRYVRYGYPYGDLREAQRGDKTFVSMRKPGWLPTAIVVNILKAGDARRGKKVKREHLIKVEDEGDGKFALVMPKLDEVDVNELAPLEVIDGQHRLWAFDEEGEEPVPDDFELPVVAYNGLDIAWQAYLFWSINVSPKKINPSHAFDLYPLLRTQDWLESVGELPVYREARAQELTESMYSHPRSVWKNRVNMLGERGSGASVSQAAWIRSLLSSFLATGRGVGRAGLFQANLQVDDTPLEWTRPQQAAFLISIWEALKNEIADGVRHLWIRKFDSVEEAFRGRSSMLNQDQGLRAVLTVANSIFYSQAEEWQLDRWFFGEEFAGAEMSEAMITTALEQIEETKFHSHIHRLAKGLAAFDWRSFDGPGVDGSSDEGVRKRSYRGSGGYALLREDVLKCIADQNIPSISRVAGLVLKSGA